MRADHTLSWKGQVLQLKRKRTERSLAGVNVNVHTTPDGEVFVYLGKQRLPHQVLKPATPAKTAKPDPTTADHLDSPEQRCDPGRQDIKDNKDAENSTDPAAKPKASKARPSARPGTRAWLYARR